jgi:ABC-type glycerol-3-phosphate transport system permease component
MATQSEALTTEAADNRARYPAPPWGPLILRYVALTLGALVVLLPIYMTVVNALPSQGGIVSYPPKLLPFECGWDICSAWDRNGATSPSPGPGAPHRYMLNSTIQTGIIVVGQLVTASLAAYAFAFLRFPGRGILFLIFLSTLMVPLEVSIIPNFQTVQWMTHKPDIQIFGFDFAGRC